MPLDPYEDLRRGFGSSPARPITPAVDVDDPYSDLRTAFGGSAPAQTSGSLFDTIKDSAPAFVTRIGAPILGGIAGGAAGTFLAGPGPGTVAGAAIGAGLAGGAGELGAQRIEGRETDLGEAGIAAALSMVPAGPIAKAIKPGMGLLARAGLHAGEGAAQSFLDTTAGSLYHRGELPTVGELGTGAVAGAALGGALGLGAERVFRPRQPTLEAPPVQDSPLSTGRVPAETVDSPNLGTNPPIMGTPDRDFVDDPSLTENVSPMMGNEINKALNPAPPVVQPQPVVDSPSLLQPQVADGTRPLGLSSTQPEGLVSPVAETLSTERRAPGGQRDELESILSGLPPDQQETLRARLREGDTDQLTGLSNRLGWSRQGDEPPAVVRLDAQALNFMNKTHGEVFGDALLAAVGRAIKASGVTRAARWGGDEFKLGASSIQDAQSLLDTVQRTLGDSIIEATAPDGRVLRFKGAKLHGAIGETDAIADAALRAAKQRAADAGYIRGGRPEGLVELPPQGNEVPRDPSDRQLAPTFQEWVGNRLPPGDVAVYKSLREEYLKTFPNADRDQFRPSASGPRMPAFQAPDTGKPDFDPMKIAAERDANARSLITDELVEADLSEVTLSELSKPITKTDRRLGVNSRKPALGLEGFTEDPKTLVSAIKKDADNPLYLQIKDARRVAMADELAAREEYGRGDAWEPEGDVDTSFDPAEFEQPTEAPKFAVRQIGDDSAKRLASYTPEGVQQMWEAEKARFIASDPQLSPNRAGELAAASVRNRMGADLDAIDQKLRGGQPTDIEIETYDRINGGDWNPWAQLQDISGSRTMLEDLDSPLTKPKFSVAPVKRDIFKEAHEKIARREPERREFLARHGEQPFRAKTNSGGAIDSVIAHQSTKEPGKWQLTWFVKDEPAGDFQMPSFEALLETAQRDFGVRLSEVNPPKFSVRPSPGQRGLMGIGDDVPTKDERPKEPPRQASMFGGEMLQGVTSRTTEGREAEGDLFTQEQRAREKAEKNAQGGFKYATRVGQDADRVDLPPRTADTMSDAIALSSPNGRMSGAARERANERLGEKLFGPDGLQKPEVPQPTEADALLRRAKELRDMAARGMSVKKFTKEAERLEAEAAAIGPKFATATTFYSALEKAAEAAKVTSASGSDWLRYLSDPKRGVKQDEIKWTGLDDFLKGKPKATRQEVLDFIRENRVEVKEVMRGEEGRKVKSWRDLNDAEVRRLIEANDRGAETAGMSRAELDEMARMSILGDDIDGPAADATITQSWNDSLREAGSDTKFSNYTLPGGENYRELLLTVPQKMETVADLPSNMPVQVRRSDLGNGRGDWYTIDRNGNWSETKYPTREAAVAAMREAHGGPPPTRQVPSKDNFHSTHYDEPNILAHVRFNDRVDADGKRVLFIEEVQSDWAQKGRREGFKTDTPSDADILAKLDAAGYKAKNNGVNWVVESKDGSPVPNRFAGGSDKNQFAHDLSQVAGMVLGDKEISRAFQTSRPPSAPFVDSTEKWTGLALKRMLRYASENGYDRIAFTPGSVQFNRWGSERFDWQRQPGTKLSFEDWLRENRADRFPEKASQGAMENARSDYEQDRAGVWKIAATKQSGGQAGGVDLEGEARRRGLLDETKSVVRTKAELTQIVRSHLEHTEDAPKVVDRMWERMQKEAEGTSMPRKEGMEGYYDKIIPEYLNKYGKKWGARVGETAVETPVRFGNNERAVYTGPPVTESILENLARRGDSADVRMQAARALADVRGGVDPKVAVEKNGAPVLGHALGGKIEFVAAQESQRVHSLDITPQMRSSVMEGQPQFKATDQPSGISSKDGKLVSEPVPVKERINPQLVKRAFPSGKVSVDRDGSVRVELPNGSKIRVTHNAEIMPDRDVLLKDHPDAVDADGNLLPGMGIAGAFKPIGRNGVIALAKVDDTHTLDHESFHAAMKLALSEKERAAVLKQFDGDEEKASDAYADWNPKTANTYFAKIMQFFQRIYRAFKPNWESAFARTRSGEAFGSFEGAPRSDPRFATAFHGSPHDFDEFKLNEKTIGTGEGAQAYGHGLYFAGSREVGEHYRKTLGHQKAVGGKAWVDPPNADPKDAAELALAREGLSQFYGQSDPGYIQTELRNFAARLPEARSFLRRMESEGERATPGTPFAESIAQDIARARRSIEAGEKAAAASRMLQKYGIEAFTPRGKLYEVDLSPDESDYLLWDKPLSEQSEKVRGALTPETLGLTFRQMDSEAGYPYMAFVDADNKPIGNMQKGGTREDFRQKWIEQAGNFNSGQGLYRWLSTDQQRASKLLRTAGVPGIKYLDGSSRNAGEGSFNYVIFDDSLVKVKAKYATKKVDGTSSKLLEPQSAENRLQRDENFRRWFGQSKVVDKNGAPMVVYHGTRADFDAFDTNAGVDFGSHFGTAAQANDRAMSRGHPDTRSADDAGSVMPVYLSVQNPLRLPDLNRWDYASLSGALKEHGIDVPPSPYIVGETGSTAENYKRQWKRQSENVSTALRKAGYDGIVYKNEHEGSDGADSYMVFDPTQIKSAIGNRGTFDPKNPNIKYATRKKKEPWQMTRAEFHAGRNLHGSSADPRAGRASKGDESGFFTTPDESYADFYANSDQRNADSGKGDIYAADNPQRPLDFDTDKAGASKIVAYFTERANALEEAYMDGAHPRSAGAAVRAAKALSDRVDEGAPGKAIDSAARNAALELARAEVGGGIDTTHFNRAVREAGYDSFVTQETNPKTKAQAKVVVYADRPNLVSHREIVAKALSEGKPVPPSVLADYPNLRSNIKFATSPKPLKPIPETPDKKGEGFGQPQGEPDIAPNIGRMNVPDGARSNAQRVIEDAQSGLKRETKQTWESLNPEIEKIQKTMSDEQLIKLSQKRQLDAAEAMALKQRVDQKARELDEVIATRDPKKIMAKSLDIVASARALANDGTDVARALNARNRLMDAGTTVDDRFLRRVFKEIPAVTDTDAANLLMLYKTDPAKLPDALVAAMKPGVLKRWVNWWKAGLLSAPSTDVAQSIGNSAEAAANIVEGGLSAGIDAILAKRLGRSRERFAGEARAELHGLMESFGPALRQLKSDMIDVHALRPAKVDVDDPRPLEQQVGVFTGKLGKASMTPFGRNQAEDRFFKSVGAHMALRKLALREAKGNEALARRLVTEAQEQGRHPELIAGAKKIAEARVFQDESSSGADWLKGAVQKWPSLGFVVPFIHTPERIAARTIARSPLGFVAGKNSTLATVKKFKAGEVGTGELSDAIARPLLGTMVLTGFAAVAKAGLMTGSGPTDEKQKAALRDSGWSPYSFKIPTGDGKHVYLPFNRFEPISSMLGFAADMVEAKDEKEASDIISKALNSLGSNLISKSYLQGLADAAGVINRPDQALATYATDLVGSHVPNIIRRAATAVDPVIRDTKPEKSGIAGFPEKAVKTVASRIPGVSTLLPARKTMTGADMERPGSAIERFASPAITSTERSDKPVERLIAKIGGDALPSVPRKELTAQGRTVKLTDEEYKVLIAGNQEATKKIERLMKDPGFKALPDSESDAKGKNSKERMIAGIYNRHRTRARNRVFAMSSFRRRLREAPRA